MANPSRKNQRGLVTSELSLSSEILRSILRVYSLWRGCGYVTWCTNNFITVSRLLRCTNRNTIEFLCNNLVYRGHQTPPIFFWRGWPVRPTYEYGPFLISPSSLLLLALGVLFTAWWMITCSRLAIDIWYPMPSIHSSRLIMSSSRFCYWPSGNVSDTVSVIVWIPFVFPFNFSGCLLTSSPAGLCLRVDLVGSGLQTEQEPS